MSAFTRVFDALWRHPGFCSITNKSLCPTLAAGFRFVCCSVQESVPATSRHFAAVQRSDAIEILR